VVKRKGKLVVTNGKATHAAAERMGLKYVPVELWTHHEYRLSADGRYLDREGATWTLTDAEVGAAKAAKSAEALDAVAFKVMERPPDKGPLREQVMTPTKFGELGAKLLDEQGGYSLDEDGRLAVTFRFISSVDGYGAEYDSLDAGAVKDYYEHRLPVVRKHGELFYGGWRDEDTGIVYLDLSTSFADREEALRFAGANGQLAIWDAVEEVSIPVPDKANKRTLTEAEKKVHWLSRLSPEKREKAMREMYAMVQVKK
jgi:hypothetical protein